MRVKRGASHTTLRLTLRDDYSLTPRTVAASATVWRATAPTIAPMATAITSIPTSMSFGGRKGAVASLGGLTVSNEAASKRWFPHSFSLLWIR
jgi:hypothetical protein